jgi:hypothetical protein
MALTREQEEERIRRLSALEASTASVSTNARGRFVCLW